jgi:hypothetical protein
MRESRSSGSVEGAVSDHGPYSDSAHPLIGGRYGNSQAIKLTAPMAMPMPKTMPASMRFDWPSP